MKETAYTNMYGNPVMECSIEEIIEDLNTLPLSVIRALLAGYIYVHDSETWKEIFNKINLDGCDE